jgi:hypothetical protein
LNAPLTPNPSNPWSAVNETYVDADPLDWPTADPADVGLDPDRLEEGAGWVCSSDLAPLVAVVLAGRGQSGLTFPAGA